MLPFRSLLCAGLLLALLCTSCATTPTRSRSNVLDFLYPEGSASGTESSDVVLQLPVRVGLAFAPEPPYHYRGSFSEDQKQELLSRVAEAFRAQEEIQYLEVVPSTYLQPGGGFENLDRVAQAFGLDLMVLVSYDQIQLSDTTGASILYWTVVGAYTVAGEKNETRTMLEAAIYDIPSRALLFHASGDSQVRSRATPVAAERELRRDAGQGFSDAMDELIANLDVALQAFGEQAATGTVRGPGTPAIQITRRTGAGGGVGAGSIGLLGGVAALLLAGCALAFRKSGA